MSSCWWIRRRSSRWCSPRPRSWCSNWGWSVVDVEVVDEVDVVVEVVVVVGGGSVVVGFSKILSTVVPPPPLPKISASGRRLTSSTTVTKSSVTRKTPRTASDHDRPAEASRARIRRDRRTARIRPAARIRLVPPRSSRTRRRRDLLGRRRARTDSALVATPVDAAATRPRLLGRGRGLPGRRLGGACRVGPTQAAQQRALRRPDDDLFDGLVRPLYRLEGERRPVVAAMEPMATPTIVPLTPKTDSDDGGQHRAHRGSQDLAVGELHARGTSCSDHSRRHIATLRSGRTRSTPDNPISAGRPSGSTRRCPGITSGQASGEFRSPGARYHRHRA